MAVTNTAIWYLDAEHDDQYWSYESQFPAQDRHHITPRALVAWRRPLNSVTEISLGADVWQWLPPANAALEAPNPAYVLVLGSERITIPLPARHRKGPAPDARPVIARLSEIWSPPAP